MKRLIAVLCGALLCLPVIAADVSFSGYGTLGFVRTNRPWTYDRFMDDGGSVMQDSILGGQMDAKFGNQFGATVQVKLGHSERNDSRPDVTLPWAFISWRPGNDWLLRAGRLRSLDYLHTENMDVGVTYDFARLPQEIYAVSIYSEFDGLSVTRTWNNAAGDFSLDAFLGKSNFHWRGYYRDNFSYSDGSQQNAGAFRVPLKTAGGALALTLRRDDDVFRAEIGQWTIRTQDGSPLINNFGYTADGFVDPTRTQYTDSYRTRTLQFGASVGLPRNFRVTGEFTSYLTQDCALAQSWNGGYLSLLKPIGRWTPYVTWAFARSRGGALDYYNAVNGTRLPESFPGDPVSAEVQAAQRATADNMVPLDQRSWALGFSYSLSATQKLKAEWQRVRIHQASSLVDAPPGADIGDTSINVLSASYSFVF